MLTLYGHPISSYTWKVLIALYENGTPFESVTVDQNTYADFIAKWPMGKFPILLDSDRKQMVTETSVIIEYLDAYYPGRTRFVPKHLDTALEVRRWDRVFDHLGNTMTKIVTDNIRPDSQRDPYGVEEAKRIVRGIYTVIEAQVGDRDFIVGNTVTLADCSAAPSLWYGTRNAPLDGGFPRIAAYLERLKAWPAFARAVKESEPLFHIYPGA
ncbi:glutathione S-transferase family protein [Terricaulis silvestris]|uniref:Glutathione S-transferase GstB n=1 Tax=Terricaulis silvestris TaxID=2686094 RepID=A0A6I6MQ38_9CAUL|nr:glutathione S-transferase family protein [Terricaulis silvestris]QGZ95506.1 Glutathione S-transferase GstB [Terricaulis silvestris]